MRIFCAVKHARNPARFYGGLWSANFYPALEQLGHTMIESQVDLEPASRFMQIGADFTPEERAVRGQLTEKIVDEIRTAHQEAPLDVVLTYFYNSHFDPGGFSEIHRLGIPTVNFYCNSIYQFELVDSIAPKVTYSWHAEQAATERYRAAGANPVWVQMGADPALYHPVPEEQRRPEAIFVGQQYADRARWLAALIRAEVPVSIYGHGWGVGQSEPAARPEPALYLGRHHAAPGSLSSYAGMIRRHIAQRGLLAGATRVARQALYRRENRGYGPVLRPFLRGPVPAGKLCSAFGSAEVVLNFSNVWSDGQPGSDLVQHVRLRDFEGPMSRVCFITGHSSELEQFYRVGVEVDTYTAPEELIDKCRFYLRNPAEAERLREAGFRRARRDHTWKSRFQELFGKIGLQATMSKSD